MSKKKLTDTEPDNKIKKKPQVNEPLTKPDDGEHSDADYDSDAEGRPTGKHI